MGRRGHLKAITSKDPQNPAMTVTGVSLSITDDFFPTADEAERMEKICPGYTRDLVNIFASQATHRQDLERNVMYGDIRRSDRGQVMAFIIGMTGIIGGVVLVILGKDVLGLAALLGSIGTLLTAFYGALFLRAKERKSKLESLEKSAKQAPANRGR